MEVWSRIWDREDRSGGTVVSIREEGFFRGYRPGMFSVPDEEDEQAEVVRLANVEIYAKRVRAGLPIFREDRKPSSAVGIANPDHAGG